MKLKKLTSIILTSALCLASTPMSHAETSSPTGGYNQSDFSTTITQKLDDLLNGVGTKEIQEIQPEQVNSVQTQSTKLLAASSVIASGDMVGGCQWSLDRNYTLTISGTGILYEYKVSDSHGTHTSYTYPSTTDEVPWKSYRDSIKKIIITADITEIPDCIFQSHTNLTEVTIPDSVEWIGWHSFWYCSNLKYINKNSNCNVNFGSNIAYISNVAFQYCTNLGGSVITVDRANGVVAQAPWGIENANITYTRELQATLDKSEVIRDTYTPVATVKEVRKSAYAKGDSSDTLTFTDDILKIENAVDGDTGTVTITYPYYGTYKWNYPYTRYYSYGSDSYKKVLTYKVWDTSIQVQNLRYSKTNRKPTITVKLV